MHCQLLQTFKTL